MEFVLDEPAPTTVRENLRTEFKAIRGGRPLNTIKETADNYAVGFLNREGGSIFWGIENDTRIIHGIPLVESERDELQLLVNQQTAHD